MRILFAMASLAAAAANAAIVGDGAWGDAVYQWSAPLEGYTLKGVTPRAYFWAPPGAQSLKAIVMGNDNMLEERIFESPGFRQRLAEADTGIVWFIPALGEITTYDAETSARVEAALAALAQKSGYSELTSVPIAALGHSAWADWPYIMMAAVPERMLAAISVKGSWPEQNRTYPTSLLASLPAKPVLLVNGEYEDGKRRARLANEYFGEYPSIKFSMFVDWGRGHFDACEDLCEFLGGYVKIAALGGDTVEYARARQRPEPASVTVPELSYRSGGAEMQYTSNHVRLRVPFAAAGDGLDFAVEPCFLSGGGAVAEALLSTSVVCGPAAERGPNRYAMRLNRRPFDADGEYGKLATLQQHFPGSAALREAVVEAELRMPAKTTGGAENIITFDPPGSITAKNGDRVRLKASSSAGAKVYYYVESGPATINDNGVLLITDIPSRAAGALEIVVVAWSWGSADEPKINTAEPVRRTITLNLKS